MERRPYWFDDAVATIIKSLASLRHSMREEIANEMQVQILELESARPYLMPQQVLVGAKWRTFDVILRSRAYNDRYGIHISNVRIDSLDYDLLEAIPAFTVNNVDSSYVEDLDVAEALSTLPFNEYLLIELKFTYNLSDEAIGTIFNKSRSSISKKKLAILRYLEAWFLRAGYCSQKNKEEDGDV